MQNEQIFKAIYVYDNTKGYHAKIVYQCVNMSISRVLEELFNLSINFCDKNSHHLSMEIVY